MKTGKKGIVLFVVFLLCIALVAAVLFNIDNIILAINKDSNEAMSGSVVGDIEKDMNTVYIDGEEYYRKKNVINYLLMGIDSFGESDDGGVGQADFLIVISFDLNAKTYTMIPINRDTMTEVEVLDIFGNSQGERVEQIALSHSYGSSREISNQDKCDNTAKAVSELLYGVKFKEYVSMTMDAVCEIVDAVGGVDVYMSEDWSEIDESFSKGSTVTLDGEMALRFIRARSGLSDSTNIARMRRQEAFLNAFSQKLGVLSMDDEEMLEAYDRAAPYLVTASGADPILEMADRIAAYKCQGCVTLPGRSVVGEKYMEFYVDENGVKSVVKEIFFNRSEE